MSGPGRIITIINSIPQPWRLLIVELADERDKAKAELQNPAVLAALPEVQAMIAGAFEAAAQAIMGSLSEFDHPSTVCTFGQLADKVCALTPADAIAARDAMIAEAVAKEREACAKEALDQRHCGYPCHDGFWNDHDPAQVGREIAAAIRKRGEG